MRAKFRTRPARGRLVLLTALLAGTMLASAAPASAAPLPPGTFVIVRYDGDCLTPATGSPSNLVFTTCQLLNLGQQFTYDRLSQQILSVGQPGNCLTVTTLTNPPLTKLTPCTLNANLQQFQQSAPNIGLRSVLYTPAAPILPGTMGYFCATAGNSPYWSGCIPDTAHAQPNQLFTFPLIY